MADRYATERAPNIAWGNAPYADVGFRPRPQVPYPGAPVQSLQGSAPPPPTEDDDEEVMESGPDDQPSNLMDSGPDDHRYGTTIDGQSRGFAGNVTSGPGQREGSLDSAVHGNQNLGLAHGKAGVGVEGRKQAAEGLGFKGQSPGVAGLFGVLGAVAGVPGLSFIADKTGATKAIERGYQDATDPEFGSAGSYNTTTGNVFGNYGQAYDPITGARQAEYRDNTAYKNRLMQQANSWFGDGSQDPYNVGRGARAQGVTDASIGGVRSLAGDLSIQNVLDQASAPAVPVDPYAIPGKNVAAQTAALSAPVAPSVADIYNIRDDQGTASSVGDQGEIYYSGDHDWSQKTQTHVEPERDSDSGGGGGGSK